MIHLSSVLQVYILTLVIYLVEILINGNTNKIKKGEIYG